MIDSEDYDNSSVFLKKNHNDTNNSNQMDSDNYENDNNHGNQEQKINTCSGKIIMEINNIIRSFNIIKFIFENSVNKFKDLENGLEAINKEDKSSEKSLPGELMEDYQDIVSELREQLYEAIHTINHNGKNIINLNEQTLIFENSIKKNKNNKKIIEFKLPCFLMMHYLVETNKNREYLFFKKSPDEVQYISNEKVTIDHIQEGSILYPVWFFYINNTLNQDYTEMFKIINDDNDDNLNKCNSYLDLLDYRVLLKKEMSMSNRKTMEAHGKYKFTYKIQENTMTLPDPYNSEKLISPKKQGIIDGYFSFDDSIDTYETIKESLVTVQNTIKVLEKLCNLLISLIDELKQLRFKLRN